MNMNKIFTEQYVEYHKVKHTGEKLYTCERCAAKCSQNNVMKERKHIHTRQKP